MSPTSIFFVPSAILEGGAEHGLDAIGSERAGEVVSELHAKLLLNLTNALLGHAKGLGAALLLTEQVVDDATAQDGCVVGLEALDKGRQSAGDSLAVLGALHARILAKLPVRDNGCDGATVSGERLVERHSTGSHRGETLAHVIGVEVEVGSNLLWGRVSADGLLSLLERGPELLGSAGAAVQRTGVGLDVLLALGSHPHASVGREGRLLGGVELASGDDDALGRTGEEVVEVNATSDVLLGDLVGEANVGTDEALKGLLVARGLVVGAEVNLLGLAEDDAGGGDGRKKVRHVGFSRVVDVVPIYIAGSVPTLAFQPFFLLIE